MESHEANLRVSSIGTLALTKTVIKRTNHLSWISLLSIFAHHIPVRIVWILLFLLCRRDGLAHATGISYGHRERRDILGDNGTRTDS